VEPLQDHLLTLKQSLLAQYKAALATLGQALERCPDGDWHETDGDYPFSQVVFHALIFTDLYLEAEPGQLESQRFHQENRKFFQDYEELKPVEPTKVYDRGGCKRYLAFCTEKCDRVVGAETEESLFGPSGFDGRPPTRLELHIYNIRHIQHHAAQLGLRLQHITGRELDWVKRG
jgi:hypothetical protein